MDRRTVLQSLGVGSLGLLTSLGLTAGQSQTDPGEKVWSREIGDGLYDPIVTEDRLYLGVGEQRIGVFDRQTGDTEWEFSFEEEPRSRRGMTVDFGTLYLIDGDYEFDDPVLRALDVSTGDQRWETSLDAGSVTARDGEIYLGGETVTRLDPFGETTWSFEEHTSDSGVPCVVDDSVYFAADEFSSHYVYELDRETGDVRWKTAVGSGPSLPCTVGGGRVYVIAKDTLYGLSRDGTRLWSSSSVDEVYGARLRSPPTYDDGGLYYGEGAENTRKYDPATGGILWSYDPEPRVYQAVPRLSSPTVADGTVYVGGAVTEGLFAVDAETGDEEWRFPTNDEVQTVPVVYDGVVYFSETYSNSGSTPRAYAIGTDHGSSSEGSSSRLKIGSHPAETRPQIVEGLRYSDDASAQNRLYGTSDGSVRVEDED